MTREEAIDVLKHTIAYESDFAEAKRMAIKALSAPQTDLISRADAIKAVNKQFLPLLDIPICEEIRRAFIDAITALPSADADIGEYADRLWKIAYERGKADAVQWWRTGKPKKQGEYTVTVKSMRGGMVELLYYGKPLMPNRKVRGMCWYRSDDEWGDVVYDDADILAWMPLPKPYKGDDDE